MSLDVHLYENVCSKCGVGNEVFSANITHNLNSMADAAGMYKALWRPEELGIKTAGELIPILESGINLMRANPGKFKIYDSENGWGTYEDFLPWLSVYVETCKNHPDAIVMVQR